MMREIVNKAMTFTVTTDLMREIVLTTEMMTEEGIDWLPLLPHHVPARTGLILFPYGVEITDFYTRPMHEERVFDKRDGQFHTYVLDQGGGDRWFIDGFLWEHSDRVSKDGHAGTPSNGLMIYPLTRWRGRDDDRPFRGLRHHNPEMHPPELVASDSTAWAFDQPGEVEWIDPVVNWEISHENGTVKIPSDQLDEEGIATLNLVRWQTRSLIWSTFRWLMDEVWIDEWADRAATKRMKRARPIIHENPLQEDGQIVIVDLRAERKEFVAKFGPSEPPWWRCRWTVRGHWAKRRYAIRDEKGKAVGPTRGAGAIEGETYYIKPKWIEEFEKGPDNAPLILKDKVGVLDR
jgi:hypothetical protein